MDGRHHRGRQPPARIWSEDLRSEKLSRALLSDHMEALYEARLVAATQGAKA